MFNKMKRILIAIVCCISVSMIDLRASEKPSVGAGSSIWTTITGYWNSLPSASSILSNISSGIASRWNSLMSSSSESNSYSSSAYKALATMGTVAVGGGLTYFGAVQWKINQFMKKKKLFYPDWNKKDRDEVTVAHTKYFGLPLLFSGYVSLYIISNILPELDNQQLGTIDRIALKKLLGTIEAGYYKCIQEEYDALKAEFTGENDLINQDWENRSSIAQYMAAKIGIVEANFVNLRNVKFDDLKAKMSKVDFWITKTVGPGKPFTEMKSAQNAYKILDSWQRNSTRFGNDPALIKAVEVTKKAAEKEAREKSPQKATSVDGGKQGTRAIPQQPEQPTTGLGNPQIPAVTRAGAKENVGQQPQSGEGPQIIDTRTEAQIKAGEMLASVEPEFLAQQAKREEEKRREAEEAKKRAMEAEEAERLQKEQERIKAEEEKQAQIQKELENAHQKEIASVKKKIAQIVPLSEAAERYLDNKPLQVQGLEVASNQVAIGQNAIIHAGKGSLDVIKYALLNLRGKELSVKDRDALKELLRYAEDVFDAYTANSYGQLNSIIDKDREETLKKLDWRWDALGNSRLGEYYSKNNIVQNFKEKLSQVEFWIIKVMKPWADAGMEKATQVCTILSLWYEYGTKFKNDDAFNKARAIACARAKEEDPTFELPAATEEKTVNRLAKEQAHINNIIEGQKVTFQKFFSPITPDEYSFNASKIVFEASIASLIAGIKAKFPNITKEDAAEILFKAMQGVIPKKISNGEALSKDIKEAVENNW